MSWDETGEEIPAICTDCGTLYPAIRLPSGEIRRVGNLPYCRCGSRSFEEIKPDQ